MCLKGETFNVTLPMNVTMYKFPSSPSGLSYRVFISAISQAGYSAMAGPLIVIPIVNNCTSFIFFYIFS